MGTHTSYTSPGYGAFCCEFLCFIKLIFTLPIPCFALTTQFYNLFFSKHRRIHGFKVEHKFLYLRPLKIECAFFYYSKHVYRSHCFNIRFPYHMHCDAANSPGIYHLFSCHFNLMLSSFPLEWCS